MRRRNNRRDRRPRAARSMRLGERLPWPRFGRLRSHAGASSAMAQPDRQHRHRLCLRRQADGLLRYPEREFVSVPAARTYSEPARPFLPQELPETPLTAQQVSDDLLDAGDVLGKRIIPTRLRGMVTIREENAAAALEVMSRFAVDPRRRSSCRRPCPPARPAPPPACSSIRTKCSLITEARMPGR